MGYHHSFTLGEEPIPATTFIRMWRKGIDGWVAESLGNALMLLENVHFWEEITYKNIVLNLKWHSIAVTVFLRLLFNNLIYIFF